MKIGSKGIQIIKHFEGFKAKAYVCPAGVLTIGYGTTKNVRPGDVITESKAMELVAQDCAEFEKVVTQSVRVPLSQTQFDALVAFSYNVGPKAFRESTLLRKLNEGDYESVPSEMARWNKGGGRVLAGLTKRRTSEGHLFATGEVKF